MKQHERKNGELCLCCGVVRMLLSRITYILYFFYTYFSANVLMEEYVCGNEAPQAVVVHASW